MNIDSIVIKQHKVSGKRSPHKPILLLLAIEAYFNKRERYLDFESYIYPKAFKLLEIVGDSSPKPEYPFWRMQNDDIWEVKLLSNVNENSSGDVSKKQLFNAGAKGGLCSELYIHAKNLSEEKYIEIVNKIIEEFIDTDAKTKSKLKSAFKFTGCDIFKSDKLA